MTLWQFPGNVIKLLSKRAVSIASKSLFEHVTASTGGYHRKRQKTKPKKPFPFERQEMESSIKLCLFGRQGDRLVDS